MHEHEEWRDIQIIKSKTVVMDLPVELEI